MPLSTDLMHEPEESARDSEGAGNSTNARDSEGRGDATERLTPTPCKPAKLDKFAIITWAKSVGWTLDRWEHLRKGPYRLKLSSIAVRYEVKIHPYGWVRLRSGYYKDLRIENGRLAGLTR